MSPRRRSSRRRNERLLRCAHGSGSAPRWSGTTGARDDATLFLQRDPSQGRVRLAWIVGDSNESAADESGELDEPVAARLEFSDGLQVGIDDAHDPLRGAGREPTGIRVEV